jgi:hypothetical protein
VGSGFDLTRALKELEALRDMLNDDKIAREVVAPALLLIQAEKLGVNENNAEILRRGGLRRNRRRRARVCGDEESRLDQRRAGNRPALGGRHRGARHKAKVEEVGGVPRVVASGGDAARLAGLYFRYGAPLLEGDDRLKNHKLAEAVKLGAEEALNVSWEGLRRRTEGGLVAADLTISDGDTKIKYNVYLWEELFLQFQSTDRSRVELAARLLRRAGIGAEVKKRKDRDVWYIRVTTDRLAAGRKELRKAIAEIVETARGKNGWVDAGKAEGWLEKLERGLTLMEGWPKYKVELARSGALVVKFGSTNRDSIQREAQRLRDMGLEEGSPLLGEDAGGREGGLRIDLKRGLGIRRTALRIRQGNSKGAGGAFVEYILREGRGGWQRGLRKGQKDHRGG